MSDEVEVAQSEEIVPFYQEGHGDITYAEAQAYIDVYCLESQCKNGHKVTVQNSRWNRKPNNRLRRVCILCEITAKRQYSAKTASERWQALSEDERDYRRYKAKQRREKNKLIVLNHYSNNELKCACCGESSHIVFLTLDHIEGGGTQHRKNMAEENKGVYSGARIYSWAIQSGFPPIFQVLCWNCNAAKHFLGKCPHKKVK